MDGKIWINGNNGQLRFNSADGKTEWVSPLSQYAVGTDTPLKRGQAVAVGLLSQLSEEAASTGAAAVVPAEPSVNQCAVGLSLEPGSLGSMVHVQSHGQIEYDLSKAGDDRYYLPPNDGSRFAWTYSDIGKPIYVSAKEPGALTLSLAEATYDGAQILCVGRLADAPLSSEEEQHVTIEIALSGDVRGVKDTSQITVELEKLTAESTESISTEYDQIIPVKLVNGVGRIILSQRDLLRNSDCDVIGVFVAPSVGGTVDLTPYYGTSVVVTRLGIIDGNFGFSPATFGKTAYLKDGIDFSTDGSETVEYKIGIGWGASRFLVDCRYAKTRALAEMIGTIKPIFEGGVTDVGFARVDDKVHQFKEDIDWTALLTQCCGKDIFLFASSEDGPWVRWAEGTGSLSDYSYFKFRELYYTTSQGRAACQIKYAREGSPEAQAYVWPEQCYQLSISPDQGGSVGKSTIRLNISNLVQLGAYMDENGQNIEAYDIIVQERSSGQILSPGFWQNNEGFWCGFEWQTVIANGQTYLMMVTVPNGEDPAVAYGPTWPAIGKRRSENLELLVTVRRRPTQYNTLYLNQFPELNPWTPLVDSANNLVIQGDRIYLGGSISKAKEQSGFIRDENFLASLQVYTKGETAGIEYKLLDDEATSFEERFSIGNTGKNVTWTFDLSEDVPSASLNANFSADFIAPSTKDEVASGEYKDSALKVFRVLYPQLFRKKSTGAETLSVLYSRIADYLKYGWAGKLFDDSETSLYKRIPDDTENLKVLAKDSEVAHALDLAWPKKDRIEYQSYFGLLARAAGETDQRLLKIERALYGIDVVSPRPDVTGIFKYVIDDAGILRFFDFLETFGFYSRNEKFSNSVSPISVKGVSSLLLNHIVENYGPYDNNGKKDETSLQNAYQLAAEISSMADFETYFRKNEELGISSSGLSHLAELWFFYKSLSIGHTYINNTRQSPNSELMFTYHDPNLIIFNAKDISFQKLAKGYAYEGAGSELAYDDAKGSPFNWPIDRKDGWTQNSHIDLIDNFYSNEIIGISDGYNNDIDNYSFDRLDIDGGGGDWDGRKASFSPQSLEGIIYDIIVKLSYIRNQFNTYQELKPMVSMVSPYKTLKVGKGPLFIEDDVDNGLFEDGGVYSSFIFKNNKIKEAYSDVLGSKWNWLIVTNEDSSQNYVCLDKISKRWGGSPALYIYSDDLQPISLTSPLQILLLYYLFSEPQKEVTINNFPFIGLSVAEKVNVCITLAKRTRELIYTPFEENGDFPENGTAEEWIEILLTPRKGAKDELTYKDEHGETGLAISQLPTIMEYIQKYEIDPEFLHKAFPTYEEQLNNNKPCFNNESLFKRMFPVFDEVYPLLQYSTPNDKKLFIGFLNGITGESSVYYRDDPWVQKPIAGNGLTWTDKSGNKHSCDFNDFIAKSADLKAQLTQQEATFFGQGSPKADTYQVGEVLEPAKAGKPLIGVAGAQLSAQERADQDGYFFDRDCFIDGWVNEAPAASVPSGGILAVSSQNKTYTSSGANDLLDVTYDTVNGVRVVTSVKMKPHSHTVTVPEKSYATRTVRRDQILTRDAFNRAPVQKTLTVSSADAYDFSQETYNFETSVLPKKTTQSKTYARHFAFKNNSYINGQCLPVPDASLRLNSSDIMKLFDLYQQDKPKKLNILGDIEKNTRIIQMMPTAIIRDPKYSLLLKAGEKPNNGAPPTPFGWQIRSFIVFSLKFQNVDSFKKNPVSIIADLQFSANDGATGESYTFNIPIKCCDDYTSYLILPKDYSWTGSSESISVGIPNIINCVDVFGNEFIADSTISPEIEEQQVDFKKWFDIIIKSFYTFGSITGFNIGPSCEYRANNTFKEENMNKYLGEIKFHSWKDNFGVQTVELSSLY